VPNENTTNATQGQKLYDPRWFIWTIVFLLVSGISLVSYITITGSGIDDGSQVLPFHHFTQKKATSTK
jgi:hypothetical protein